jgi:hypothetical protein
VEVEEILLVVDEVDIGRVVVVVEMVEVKVEVAGVVVVINTVEVVVLVVVNSVVVVSSIGLPRSFLMMFMISNISGVF